MSDIRCECGSREFGLIHMRDRYWCVSCIEKRIAELEGVCRAIIEWNNGDGDVRSLGHVVLKAHAAIKCPIHCLLRPCPCEHDGNLPEETE